VFRSDLRQLGSAKTGFMYENATAVKEIDWRAKGAVTEVKNQKQVLLPFRDMTKVFHVDIVLNTVV
jgi:hypothetical protein